jgi:predicted lipoprotein
MRERVSPGVAIGAVAVAVFLVVALLFGFTVVSTQEEAALTVEFDPVTYVDDNWEAVQTAITDNAVQLADVLNEFEPEADGKIATDELTPIAEELGRITTGEAHVYSVSGSGTVTDVDVESSKGSIGVAVDGYEGPVNVRFWVGTRIPSDESSVRDATGLIEFGDFRDQTEYGKVAKEINSKVVSALEDLDKENLEGKHIDFTGAFTLRTFNQPTIDVSEIHIVPIAVTES